MRSRSHIMLAKDPWIVYNYIIETEKSRKKMNTNVQSHGDNFENEIHLAVHGKTKKEYETLIEGGYTAKFDIAKGVLADFNGSVKVTNGNSIGCGDIIRMYEGTKGNDITFIVGVWQQTAKKVKTYSTIYEFYLDPSHHNTLWGNIKLKTLKKFDSYVKNIPHGKKGQSDNKKLWKQKKQNIYASEGRGLVDINAKIDSKTQRRVQCAFKIKDLIESGIPYKKFTKTYRGISLPYIQDKSPARTFNK